eukprot:COSAG01_NODE_4938_length_4609_cov_4.379157_2_plen_61_part_00
MSSNIETQRTRVDARAAGCEQVATQGLPAEVLRATSALSLGSRSSDPVRAAATRQPDDEN